MVINAPETGFRPEDKIKKIPVIEIFGPVIEGEGKLCGVQTFFIRFGLCDYKCQRCDSMHAVDPKLVKAGAEWLTEEQIFDALMEVKKLGHAEHIMNVTFSGGNPCIHDLTNLVAKLHVSGHHIFVETQGTKRPQWLDLVDEVVISPKSPGMGEKFEEPVFKNFFYSLRHQWKRVSVKIVIFSSQDIEFAYYVSTIIRQMIEDVTEPGMMARFKLHEQFFLSLGNDSPPVFEVDYKGNVEQKELDAEHKISIKDSNINLASNLLQQYNVLSEEIMKDPRMSFARFLPQLHVLVWGNEIGR